MIIHPIESILLRTIIGMQHRSHSLMDVGGLLDLMQSISLYSSRNNVHLIAQACNGGGGMNQS